MGRKKHPVRWNCQDKTRWRLQPNRNSIGHQVLKAILAAAIAATVVSMLPLAGVASRPGVSARGHAVRRSAMGPSAKLGVAMVWACIRPKAGIPQRWQSATAVPRRFLPKTHSRPNLVSFGCAELPAGKGRAWSNPARRVGYVAGSGAPFNARRVAVRPADICLCRRSGKWGARNRRR